MEQNTLEFVANRFGTALAERGYKKSKPEEKGIVSLLVGEDNAYSILYDREKKHFVLRTCEVEDAKPDLKWKSISTWLFDPETDSRNEAQGIADDFIETVCGKQQTAVVRTKKKRKKDDDNNVDPLFFFNRFVGVFPELKEELNEERASFGDVRAVTFARKDLLPKIDAICSAQLEKDKISRCCTLLNELYVSGDMDVRSVITIVILNGLSDRAAENIKPLLSEELAKSYKAALKLKGKKIKPEKKKKRKKMMAATLNDMKR